MQEKKLNRLKFLAVAIFIFALMFALNYLMPLHRDDYDYSMVWGTWDHIENFADVLHSTEKHYLLHGGRLFTVFCLNLFLWLGKFTFDLANALMFTLLIILIYFHARRDFKISGDAKIFAGLGLLAWLSFAHFGEVAVWKSGSTVYLWSAVPAAIFLLPYNFCLAGKKFKNILLTPAIFLLGIIAGCGVENLSATITFLTAAISIYCAKKNNLQAWMPVGSLGSLIGFIILLASPGNFVRYGDQSGGKGILTHIGNQFAGNGEMFLYILPMFLILICALKILKISIARQKNISIQNAQIDFPKQSKILLTVAGVFIISYLSGGLITGALQSLGDEIIFPAIGASEKFIERADNFFEKSEEMIIYWLIIFAIFLPLKNSLGNLNKKISFREVIIFFPQVKFSLSMFALGFFNNFVMIAAPTFPARATFSSVIFFLIGAVAIFRIDEVREVFSTGKTNKILKLGALLIGSFTIISALWISFELKQENDLRIDFIKQIKSQNWNVAIFPPLEIKNRALRHVFFADFDNFVTKEGLRKFYRLRNIKIGDKFGGYWTRKHFMVKNQLRFLK